MLVVNHTFTNATMVKKNRYQIIKKQFGLLYLPNMKIVLIYDIPNYLKKFYL
jgi:hypothetical protein